VGLNSGDVKDNKLFKVSSNANDREVVVRQIQEARDNKAGSVS
jgi:hypothetical protein